MYRARFVLICPFVQLIVLSRLVKSFNQSFYPTVFRCIADTPSSTKSYSMPVRLVSPVRCLCFRKACIYLYLLGNQGPTACFLVHNFREPKLNGTPISSTLFTLIWARDRTPCPTYNHRSWQSLAPAHIHPVLRCVFLLNPAISHFRSRDLE